MAWAVNRVGTPRGSFAGGAAVIDSQPSDGRDRTELGKIDFGPDGLAMVRDVVAARASACGLAEAKTDDLVLAVHELATNSVRHGGGWGTCRLWRDGATLVCEVSDRGWITDPLVGLRKPPANQLGGRGLWLVNQLCDTVELRSSPDGTVVRVRISDGG